MEKKISVIIPNYNGKSLLARNLPQVLKTCQNCEVIVVDDGSTDDSVEFLESLRTRSGLRSGSKTNWRVKLIVNRQNLGFAKTVNRGVQSAKGELVLLLNSDVYPHVNFLKPLLQYFEKAGDTNKVFAVAIADESHEGDKIVVRGKGGANFKRGFFNHFAASIVPGETLWVSGGSGLFDRQKFESLGGFDKIYAPFYWEDIDLSYRAQKVGYKCLFEPKSRVDHYHEEGAIKKTYSPYFIKKVAYKNQFIFVWKNISDYFLILQHLAWLPYHFARALIRLDLAFFAGFIWAISQIPKLIFDYSLITNHYSLSDKEVLRRFEKP